MRKIIGGLLQPPRPFREFGARFGLLLLLREPAASRLKFARVFINGGEMNSLGTKSSSGEEKVIQGE